MSKVQNVFLIGAKSLGAYGGYETFVYKLTEYHQNNPNIKYHVERFYIIAKNMICVWYLEVIVYHNTILLRYL